jgi:hypothetical protein
MTKGELPVFLLVILEEDAYEMWDARVDLRPGVGAVGRGPAREEAADDCRVALMRQLESMEPEKWLPSRRDFVFVPPGPDKTAWPYAFQSDAEMDAFLRDYHGIEPG